MPTANNGNLSELDSLLQDLSSARYGSHLEKGAGTTSPSQTFLNDSIKRPSVDSLLDELSNAHNSGPIYAVPNGYVLNMKMKMEGLCGRMKMVVMFKFLNHLRTSTPHSKSPGGKHVTITVRETKTERLTPVNQPYSGKLNAFRRFDDYSENTFVAMCCLKWEQSVS